MKITSYLIICTFLFFASCIAPRSVINSGKVTPQGNFVAGVQYSGNISTAPINAVKKVVEDNIDQLPGFLGNTATDTINLSADSIQWLNDNLESLGKGAIAFASDPIGVGMEYYIRYGIANRLDVGYKLAGTAHTFDVQYQFLGPVGYVDDITNQRWYGSIGLQYAGQKVSAPKWLTGVEDYIDFEFKRRDFMVPIIWSRSFGNEEAYGSIAFGMVLNYTQMKYAVYLADFATLVDENGNVSELQTYSFQNQRNIFAYGGFVNMKLGYKYVYVLPSLAVYHQRYGEFQNFIGPNFNLKGFTIVPTMGLRFRLGKSIGNPKTLN